MYRTKPHTLKYAFKFEADCTFPDWFTEALHRNRVQVTRNIKDVYISIYSRKGNVERCLEGEWVCMNDFGKIYTITDQEFHQAYEEITDAEQTTPKTTTRCSTGFCEQLSGSEDQENQAANG